MMQKLLGALAIVLVGLNAGGCASIHYKKVKPGKLSGSLLVEWRKPDSFVFIPSEEDPLTFERDQDEEIIQPGRLWTDGGSIPRAFWVFKHYSPWGYGPAFIIHDWLFHMQDCELPGYESYSVKEAAIVMSEVMKTLMEGTGFDYGSKTALYLMYKAVQSPAAVSEWEDKECRSPILPRGDPDETFVIRFQ